MIQNADKILIRASSISKIMTNDRSGKQMGETCKSYLKELYREIVYGRKKEVLTKQMEKGVVTEENAITLFSLHTKTFYKKNAERIENQFLSGHPDFYTGESISNVEEGFDTKVSWSIFSFPFPSDILDKEYMYQDLSYMALTGAKKWTTVFCLVNTPAYMIQDEKRRLMYKMNASETDESYLQKCMEIERNMIFDLGEFMREYPNFDLDNKKEDWTWDIDRKDRIVTFPVIRDEEEIQKIYARVLEARIWMNKNLFGI